MSAQIQTKADKAGLETGLIDREGLAERWRCSTMTIKRIEESGKLERLTLGPRAVRYRMEQVLLIEKNGLNAKV